MALYTHHLPKWKEEEVEYVKTAIKQFKLVGLVDMYGIPATQVQQIRRNLKGSAELRMIRNTLILHAFNDLGGDVTGLDKYISGHSAMIFTNDNPFKLNKMLERTKTKMAARPGEAAPEDIIVEKGPTSFKPGPIVAELQQVGIPAAIEAGKVKIRETKTVVKKGEVISKKLADVLAKLDVKPMDVGLLLQAAFYDSCIYEPSVLAIDDTAFYNNLVLAATQAYNLSVNAAIPTKDTAAAIVTKAVREARSLAVEAAVYSPAVIELIIAKAVREAGALNVKVD